MLLVPCGAVIASIVPNGACSESVLFCTVMLLNSIIEFSELGNFIDSPVRTYSSGMYMRLAFSVAINVDAEILLIDEILAVGDQHFQDKCFKKLQELKESDKTIVIVTHDLNAVKNLCTRAIWINQGEVRMDAKPKEVIEEYLKVCD